MAQGLRAKPKKKANPKKKPLTKRQRTGAAAKKTVRRKNHDSATKLINASVEKRVAGAAARGGQHFELGTVSDASKAACAEQRVRVGDEQHAALGVAELTLDRLVRVGSRAGDEVLARDGAHRRLLDDLGRGRVGAIRRLRIYGETDRARAAHAARTSRQREARLDVKARHAQHTYYFFDAM